MRAKRYVFCLVGFLFLMRSAFGQEDLSQYGKQWQEYQQSLNDARADYAGKCTDIKQKTPAGPERERLLKEASDAYRAQSQDLARTQRDPIQRKVIEEMNRRAGAKQGGQRGQTSSEVKSSAGTKSESDSYRGAEGDLDAGGGTRSADQMEGVLQDMGIKVPVNNHGGTVEAGGGFNLTINKEGAMGAPGSAAHQAQVGVDARNPETYVSETMDKDQPGRSAVEVQDHIKKANLGGQQNLAKGASKSGAYVSDSEIQKIMDDNGVQGSPEDFRNQMQSVKEGRGNVPGEEGAKFENACKDVLKTAEANTQAQAQSEMTSAQNELNRIKGSTDPALKERAQDLRNQIADSREKLEETQAANQEAGSGGGSHEASSATGNSGETAGTGKSTVGPQTGEGSGAAGAVEAETGAGALKGAAKSAAGTAGELTEGAAYINQASKVRDGILEGNNQKIAEGIAGKDTADRTQMQGAKDVATAEGQREQAVGEYTKGELGKKLREMGASKDEVDSAMANYDKDPTALRQLVADLKDRNGGAAETKTKGLAVDSGTDLNGAGDESDTAGNRLKEGAKQAGSYAHEGGNILTGGGLGRYENSKADADDVVKSADQVDKSTENQVENDLYGKLRRMGATPEEARAAVNSYEQDPKQLRALVADLKERGGQDSTGGKGEAGKGDRNIDLTEDDTAVDRVGQMGKDMKTEIVDKPGKFVKNTKDDIDAWLNKDEIDKNLKDAKTGNAAADKSQQAIYDNLIQQGATPDEARDAVKDLASGNRETMQGLIGDLKGRGEAVGGEKGAAGTGEKGENAGEGEKGGTENGGTAQGEKTGGGLIVSPGGYGPAAGESDKDGVENGENAGANVESTPEPGPKNDAGQTVNAGDYQSGDTVVTQDGTEYANHDGNWEKTGNNYGPYEPGSDLRGNEAGIGDYKGGASGSGASGDALAGFVGGHEQQLSEQNQNAVSMMNNVSEIDKASTAGDQEIANADHVRDKAGQDMNDDRDRSASQIASADQANSMSTVMANSLQQGIQQGLSAAGTAIGSAAAGQASSAIFDQGGGDSHSSADAASGGSVAGAGGTEVASASQGGSGGGGGGGCNDGDNGVGQGTGGGGGCNDGDNGAGQGGGGVGACGSAGGGGGIPKESPSLNPPSPGNTSGGAPAAGGTSAGKGDERMGDGYLCPACGKHTAVQGDRGTYDPQPLEFMDFKCLKCGHKWREWKQGSEAAAQQLIKQGKLAPDFLAPMY